jgi:hypothetical protein
MSGSVITSETSPLLLASRCVEKVSARAFARTTAVIEIAIIARTMKTMSIASLEGTHGSL